jgi:hypothetical protein
MRERGTTCQQVEEFWVEADYLNLECYKILGPINSGMHDLKVKFPFFNA